ncbi:DUF6226 family protein [Microbacterium marinilacus]|uniref:DUF6226 family protein n=1 Tax=Microbacterium marinilacus TaxID=415209 RepID=UPI001C8E6BEE|nr:DUF6226 family protein [Microbacterium marinilacus]MBY0689231.1 DUF6226 family protein [Microbacterium marinilacus]
MSPYVRPAIETPVFRDADGAVIDYGERWPGSPPEETYSIDTHPERFAPLHVVADALVAHLRNTYDVEVDDRVEAAADLPRNTSHDVIRTVRIRPTDPECATLTLVFTAYPGIHMHAGLLHDFHYPVCGCDACDSTWQAEADELEQAVFAVVSGNYRETIERGPDPWIGHTFTYPDGARSGKSRAQDFPVQRVEDAEPTLRGLRDGWASWPRMTSPS